MDVRGPIQTFYPKRQKISGLSQKIISCFGNETAADSIGLLTQQTWSFYGEPRAFPSKGQPFVFK